MIPLILLQILFVYLFVRECKLERTRFKKQELLGDLHMLKEFKKHFEEMNQDTSRYDDAIRELENELRKL